MKTATALAALFHGKEDIRTDTVELPRVEDYGLKLRVISCGVCGSDVRYFLNGPSSRYKIPGILGHEVCAEVTEVGDRLDGYETGMRVVLSPIIPCMSCRACAAGLDNICEKGWGFGNSCDGGMVEQMVIPSRAVLAGCVVCVPHDLDPDAAALTELVGCCYNGLEQMGVRQGDRVLVVGDGQIGLTFVQLLKQRGAGLIVTTGHRKLRQKLSKNMGADEALNTDDVDLGERYGASFDHIIIAASSTDAAAEAASLLFPGGSLLLFSGFPKGAVVPYDVNDIHYKQLRIIGSIDCTIQQFRRAAQLIPMLRMEELVSASYTLDRTKEAFYASKEPEAVKILIKPST